MTLDFQLGSVVDGQDGRQFGRRIEVAETAADRAAIARLEVSDIVKRLAKDRTSLLELSRALQRALARDRANPELSVGVLHLAKLRFQAVCIHQMVEYEVAHRQHRHQRLTAGQHASTFEMRQHLKRLPCRSWSVIVERRRFHLAASSWTRPRPSLLRRTARMTRTSTRNPDICLGAARAALSLRALCGLIVRTSASCGARPLTSSASKLPANSLISSVESSSISPAARPYWATDPPKERSVSRSTRVLCCDTCVSRQVSLARAVPRPLLSFPLAWTTRRWLARSISVMTASPPNVSRTGPRAIATVPRKVRSSTTSVRAAPGKHRAINGTSSKAPHVSSTVAGAVSVFWISIVRFSLFLRVPVLPIGPTRALVLHARLPPWKRDDTSLILT